MTLQREGEDYTFTREGSSAGGTLAWLPFGAQLDFKTILPKTINPNALRFEILRELEAIAKTAVDLYKKTTEGWSFQPQFSYRRMETGGQGGLTAALAHGDIGIAVAVVENGMTVDNERSATTAEVYTYIDQGTSLHPIQAAGEYPMGFLPGYLARTTPGSLSSGESARFGDGVHAWEVLQSIEPRGFSDMISDIIQEEIDTRIPDAIQRGLKKAIVQ